MPGFVGLPEILLFGIVALLIFGPKKLPEMGRSLGKGMREFKDSVSGNDDPTSTAGDETRPVLAQVAAADAAPNPFEEHASTPASEPVATAAPVR